MNTPTIAHYGSWKSPILASDLAASTIRLSEVMLDGGDVYWIELRPAEAGRCVVVRHTPDGRTEDVNPPPYNARTRVHEYGGGSYLPAGGEVYFTHFADQRLYRVARRADGRGPAPAPVAVTPPGDLRYADFIWDGPRRRLITVLEDHGRQGEPRNSIAAVCPEETREETRDRPHFSRRKVGSVPSFFQVLAQGNDFYSSPRLSPDGRRLAWLTWNHPDMPWDGCELRVAPLLADGRLGEAGLVAGSREESIAQPEWSPDGTLYFVSDRTDWWNLYRWREGRVEAVTQLEAEFASPQWVFRMANYGFDPAGSPVRGGAGGPGGAGRAICAYFQDGLSRLAEVDLATCKLQEIATPYTSLGSVRVGGGKAVFLGASAQRAAAVVSLDLATGKMQELARSTRIEYDAGYISAPQSVEFPTTGGGTTTRGEGRTAHGLFYAPRNKDFAAPAGEKPPLVVMVHGGPTSATTSAFRGGIQYYTSRGLAVLDVNYGGSSGYGRKYRQRLSGNWGIVDVDDCCNGAAFLASYGWVDGKRMAITGGSAGGYTVLAALAMRKTFAAGASHYGVSDCEALAKETHKFESRYLDRLIGPYPQRRDLYVERSPIHHVDGLSCPVIFFQGLEDKIVPPDQARMMVEALRKKRLPVALVEFEGEQHGFRKAPNIQRAMEAELCFFARVFGFTVADKIEPVTVEGTTTD